MFSVSTRKYCMFRDENFWIGFFCALVSAESRLFIIMYILHLSLITMSLMYMYWPGYAVLKTAKKPETY